MRAIPGAEHLISSYSGMTTSPYGVVTLILLLSSTLLSILSEFSPVSPEDPDGAIASILCFHILIIITPTELIIRIMCSSR